jgi:hypothetical protein
MPQHDRNVLVGWMFGPGFQRPVRAELRSLANGQRVWKSVTALRWVPLPRAAVFTPDARQPQADEPPTRPRW